MMKLDLKKIDKTIYKTIIHVGRTADKLGVRAYLAGGIVRDIFLNRENFDIDIVVESQLKDFVYVLSKSFNAHVNKFSQFNTASMTLKNGLTIDFALLRQETYAYPGALPTVHRGSLRDDMLRRDFSINALALSINSDTLGQLFDEFEGLKDLRRKRIRILHKKSFEDDPTRILRAIRFEQRFCFKIEKETMKCLKRALSEGYASKVKPPRYFNEFIKIYHEKDPGLSLRRLKKLGSLKFLGSRLTWGKEAFSILNCNTAVLNRIRNIDGKRDYWLAGFLTTIENLPEIQREKLPSAFHLKKTDGECVILLSKKKEIIKKLSAKKISSSEIFKILNKVPDEFIDYLFLSSSSSALKSRIEKYLSVYSKVSLEIGGKDLRKVGFDPGPRMGKAVQELLLKKIDRKLKTREDELIAAQQLLAF